MWEGGERKLDPYPILEQRMAENPRDVGSTESHCICTPCRNKRAGRPNGARPMRGPSESHPLRQKTANAPQGAFSFVRPAGRTHLEVKVLYEPGRGNR